MKRSLVAAAAIAVFIAAVFWKNRETAPQPPLTGSAMGTGWRLVWRGDAPRHLHREVAGVLEHWEQVMSQWRADSDLSRFNRGEPATADLARVVRLARETRDATAGAFDPEILARVHAAGHGPPGSGIDLSGIGKGFAADRVAERIKQLGVHDFIFELGGDLVAGDGDWNVGLERPDPGTRAIARTLTLRGRALATSGNTHQPRHIIDPRTGSPVERPPSSVTVIAADAATADAWATALFVLGPDFQAHPAGLDVIWLTE